MKLYYKGKYNLDPDSLPHDIHQPGAVPFKEAKDTKTMGLIANILAVALLILFGGILYLRVGSALFSKKMLIVCVFAVLVIFPHELLHALCFRKDVYLYTNLKHGMVFVVGTETMSKGRFIFMCMLPNIVFGLVPYIAAMLYPSLVFIGAFGAVSLSMGSGDFYNVYHAITQMPKGARTYLYKFNSFWYLPLNERKTQQ